MSKKNNKKPKNTRTLWVAEAFTRSGAGAHTPKKGKGSYKRVKRIRDWD